MSAVRLKALFPFLVILGSYALWMTMPAHRTYFVFLIGSYFLAYVIYRFRKEDAKSLFDKRIWMHETSLNEAYILLISFLFISLVINNGYIFEPRVFAKAFYMFFEHFNLPIVTTKDPSIFAGALYIGATILASEAAYYYAHRIQHSSRVLWEFHKVHHSAQVMTPFTSLRQHPVELALNFLMNALFIGFTAAIFFYFYPSIGGLVFITQTHLVFGLFLFLGGSLAHSHAWISYGKGDEYIISPAMHQIHHSTDPKHYDKNFGFMLTLFDRMGGTLYIPKQREDLTFGLGGKQDEQFTTLHGSMIEPVKKAIKHARKSPQKTQSNASPHATQSLEETSNERSLERNPSSGLSTKNQIK